MNIKKLKTRKLGIVLLSIQTLLSILFVGLLLHLNILKTSYVVMIALGLLAIGALVLLSQLPDKLHVLGKIFACMMCVVMVVGSYGVYKTRATLGKVTGPRYETDEVSLIVLKEDTAQIVNDAADYIFGYSVNHDKENTDKIIEKLNEELDKSIATLEVEDLESLVEDLYSKQVQVIILNEAFRDLLLEFYPDFDKDTKVLGKYEEVRVVEEETPSPNENTEGTNEHTDSTFSVYLSGKDTYGDLTKTSRSDVNIILTVNTKTKQILLTNTPRDYYVAHPRSGGMLDKLTHAGIYGVKNSKGALEMLYDTKIKYYLRVNFTSFEEIVDALGGVTVYSDYDFDGTHGGSFVKGYNKVDGKSALGFVRERYAFASGDIQRGKNQQYLIEAIIKKAASPSILTGFTGIMDGIGNNIDTNMTVSEITDLVKMQLEDAPDWNIVTIGVTGTGASRTTYSNQKKAGYVMYPNEKEVAAAKKMIKYVLEGKEISEDLFKELKK